MEGFNPNNCYFYNIRKLSRIANRYFDNELSRAKIFLKYTQVCVLHTLVNNPDLCSSEIQKIMGIERTTLARSMEYMERRGILLIQTREKKRFPINKKCSITEKGLAILAKALDECKKIHSRLIENISYRGNISQETLDKFQSLLNEISLSTEELVLNT